MNKEEKKKLFKEFENDKEASFIYFKAHRIYLLCFIGVVYSIIATIFDIVKDVKYYAYLMDAFLFIFCIIFLNFCYILLSYLDYSLLYTLQFLKNPSLYIVLFYFYQLYSLLNNHLI